MSNVIVERNVGQNKSMLFKKISEEQAPVAHAYDPSYLGD
jgi:hypothetical protein